jgi:hypothetical protein
MGKRPRGSLPNWQPSTDRQAAILDDLVALYRRHYADDTLPRGGRGAFYDLRPHGLASTGWTYRKPDSAHPVKTFAANEIHPAAVQEVLVLARRAGIIPEAWVADGRMPDSIGDTYDESVDLTATGIAVMVRRAPERYYLDPQRFQPLYVEVLCEAADLQPRLARIANPYGVTVYSGSGFDGLKGKRQMAERALERDRPTVVLHIGDRDRHGEDIYLAVGEDVVGWFGDGIVAPVAGVDYGKLAAAASGHAPAVWFARLGLLAAQADELGILDADGKAEVDAVPVRVMDGWLADAIEALQDPACRERHEAEQAEHRERLPQAIRDALNRDDEGGA